MSTDAGTTWVSVSTLYTSWNGVYVSNDFNQMVATDHNAQVYHSIYSAGTGILDSNLTFTASGPVIQLAYVGATVIKPCFSGTYAAAGVNPACTLCAAGKYSLTGSTSCTPCTLRGLICCIFRVMAISLCHCSHTPYRAMH